jgi:hypothetical protein
VANAGTAPREPRCSFCGKSQHHVQKVVAGPGVHICNECVDLCNDIMDETIAGSPPEGATTTDGGVAWKVLSPNNPAIVDLGSLQRQLARTAMQLARLEASSSEGTIVADDGTASKVLWPDNPAAVQLRTLQRQLTVTARELANLVVALEISPDSEGR